MIRPGDKVIVHGEVEQVIFGKEIKTFVIRPIPAINEKNPNEVFMVLEGAVEKDTFSEEETKE